MGNIGIKSNRLITPFMNKWLGGVLVLLALLAVAQAKPVFENKSTCVDVHGVGMKKMNSHVVSVSDAQWCSLRLVQLSADSTGCLLCEWMATELFNWMSLNTTAPEIETWLDNKCMKLSFPLNYEVRKKDEFKRFLQGKEARVRGLKLVKAY